MTKSASVQPVESKRVFLRLLLAMVVLGGVYFGLAIFVGRHVATSTTVDGIAIGGMSPDEATVTLERVLGIRASRPVHLETPSRTVDIDPGTAGLEVDLEATLSELTGLTLNPVNLWEHLTGGESQPLKIRVNRALLTAAVTEAARAVDSPTKEGSITFAGGKATTVVSAAGQAVKVPATTDAVTAAWPRQQVVKAVMSTIEPTLSADEINRAASEFAVPAMSGPVTVVAGRTTFRLQPVRFAPALSMVPDGNGTLRPSIDAPRLLAVIRAAGSGIERTPVDATVRLVAGSPRVLPAVTGLRIDAPSVPASFLAALTSPSRTATITVAPVPPKVTTAVAQGWGIREEISTFTTHFTFNPPRVNNIKIAVRTLNDTLVRPGGQFSLNATLGQRTPAKGYQQAPVINAGRLVKDYGGGVSQVSTTTFNAAFFSGVRIEQYTPHSFYISRYPEGREATVSWPDVDQKWTNDTGFGILIKAFVSGNDLTVTFFGTKTWDVEAVKGPRRNVVQPKNIVDSRAGCVPQSPTPGFDVTVTRIFKKNGAQVKTSTFNTHYIPEDNVQCTHPSAG
ncbi:MAG: VanW family protein [Dermatophilaceae bacterium]